MDVHEFLPCPPLFDLDTLEEPDGFPLSSNPEQPQIHDDGYLQGACLEDYPNPSAPLQQNSSIDPQPHPNPSEEVACRPTDQLPLWSWESFCDSSASTQNIPQDYSSYPCLLSDDGMDVSVAGPVSQDNTAMIDTTTTPNFTYLADKEISQNFFQALLQPYLLHPAGPQELQQAPQDRGTACSSPMLSYPPSPAILDSPLSASSRASPAGSLFSSSDSSPDEGLSSLGSPHMTDLETETILDPAQLEFSAPFGMEYVPTLDVEAPTYYLKAQNEHLQTEPASFYAHLPLYEQPIGMASVGSDYQPSYEPTMNGTVPIQPFFETYPNTNYSFTTFSSNINCENGHDGNHDEQYLNYSSDGYSQLSSSSESVEEYRGDENYGLSQDTTSFSQDALDYEAAYNSQYIMDLPAGSWTAQPSSEHSYWSGDQTFHTARDAKRIELMKERDYYKLGLPAKAAAIGKLPPRVPLVGVEVAASRARARASLQPVPALDYAQHYKDTLSRLLTRKVFRTTEGEDYVDTLINKSKVIRLTHSYQQQAPLPAETSPSPCKKRRTKRDVLENSMLCVE